MTFDPFTLLQTALARRSAADRTRAERRRVHLRTERASHDLPALPRR
jgi:hypothetical protein